MFNDNKKESAMSNKKRNKKHNKVEAIRRNNSRILKGFAVAFTTGVGATPSPEHPIKLINLNGELMQITQTMAHAIADFKYKWFVYLVVGCYNSKGNRELKIDRVPCTEPYLQSELVEYLNTRHSSMITDLTSKNVRIEFVGWIAKPSGAEFTDEKLYDIFEGFGSWGADD